MIRPATVADTERLIELTAATGFFRPLEIEALHGVLHDYFHGDPGEHFCFVAESVQIEGYVYIGAAEMTDRTWYTWWIAVDAATQGKGIGRELMRFAEEEARKRGGRAMFVETSGTDFYEPTRRFYLNNGYDREATLRDFYRDGDDMVVFRKQLAH